MSVDRAVVVGVVMGAFVLIVACGSSDPGGSLGGTSGTSGTSGSGLPPTLPPKVARTTTIPGCTLFVDVANNGAADGTVARPHKSLAVAINSAANDAIVCVAEGTYAEALTPGVKYFTLAGGFQSGHEFKVRDSALYVSKAKGSGSNTFFRVSDPGPTAGQLSAIDGFEITGYSQAIVREIYYSQKFDITNNYIHDNTCAGADVIGGGFSLSNVSGSIRGNVLARNSCSRGGAGALIDTTNENSVSIISNRVESNAGTQPESSHGGGLYLFGSSLTLTSNEFTANTVTGWGAGLYVGAFTGGGQPTTANLSWNVFYDNRAGNYAGGFFCDDGAHCISDHDTFDKNCGGNIATDADGTTASFDHLINSRSLTVDCGAPGAGVLMTRENTNPDVFTFTNSIFWGNAKNLDFAGSCDSGCGNVKVSVTYSNVQSAVSTGGITVSFGAGNQESVDPLFVDPNAHDFHLKSTHGHWTPGGYVKDSADSPGLRSGDPAGPTSNNPPQAGNRSELGAYGNSAEASYVQ